MVVVVLRNVFRAFLFIHVDNEFYQWSVRAQVSEQWFLQWFGALEMWQSMVWTKAVCFSTFLQLLTTLVVLGFGWPNCCLGTFRWCWTTQYSLLHSCGQGFVIFLLAVYKCIR